MATKPKLTLVTLDPADYGLAGIVLRQHAEILKRAEEIQAALSLYFQWPAHRRCVTKINGNWLDCTLLYDEDEASVSEITIQFASPRPPGAAPSMLVIRFEIFRACYECEVTVLGEAEEFIIVEPPAELLIYKHRRAPRFLVTKESPIELQTVTWTTSSRGPVSLPVIELSIFSVIVETDSSLEGDGELLIDGHQYRGFLSVRHGNRSVIILSFADDIQAGRFFDAYRRVAHSGLEPRSALPPDEVIRLYQAYLDQHFPPDRHDEIRSKLESTWNSILSGTHTATADYIVMDAENRVTGASSASLAFLDGDRPQWALHQLCALKIPENLNLSESLYTWRLDYLGAKPSNGDMVGWYSSKSRWVERIYTKFHILRRNSCLLSPIIMSDLRVGEGSIANDHKEYMIGESKRVVASSEKYMVGLGPQRLSVSGGLDLIFERDPQNAPGEQSDVENAMALVRGKTERIYLASLKGPVGQEEVWRAPVDRYFRIPLSEAIELRASVEHSLAATKAKWNQE